MGIQNKDGALYFATGVDNTGLYSGKREAIGIIKAMAGEITSFDVFGGIGVSAAMAFAKAAKGAYEFEKQFQQSMKEVATLSSGIKGSLTDFMNQVLEITQKIPIQANDAAKALYQIVSAGHDGADGMKILEASAKAAIGGVTETATAADAITTILNAYKLDASKAQQVSDQLFTTVRLGKTDFGQLGKSIAQAAPIAASFGIDIKEVLAAVASITKQGVPTSEAMTKIRAAILGAANQLGDAAFEGRTFQEALQLIYDKAGGSSTKLKELLGTDEALQAALMITGKNAQSAAQDLEEVGKSAGAAEAAFQEMASSAQNQMQLLQNNITAFLRPMGEAILKEVSDIAASFNEAFDNGDVQESMRTLGALITTVTSAFIGYKGSIVAVTTAKTVYHTITAWITKQKAIEAANLVLNKGLYAAEATTIARNTSMRVLLTNALKAQFAATLKASAAMLTNPYVLAAAAVAALGYAIYTYATQVTEAERIQRKYNESIIEAQKKADEEKKHLEDLITVLNNETSSNAKRLEAMNEIRDNYSSLFQKYIDEKGHVKDLIGLWKEYNEARGVESVQQHKDDLEDINERIKKKLEEKEHGTTSSMVTPTAFNKRIDDELAGLYTIRRQAEKRIEKDNLLQWQQDLKGRTDQQIQWELAEAKRLQEAIIKYPVLNKQGVRVTQGTYKSVIDDAQLKQRIAILNSEQSARGISDGSVKKANYSEDYEKAKKDWEKAKSVLTEIAKDRSKFNTEDYKKAKEDAEKKKKAFKELGGAVDDTSQQNSLSDQRDKIKQLMDSNSLEIQRQSEDLENKLTQSKIDAIADGFKKEQAQRELNNRIELQNIKRQKEDYIRAYIESQKKIFDAGEELKARENKNYQKKTFDSSSVSVDTSAYDDIISNTSRKQVLEQKESDKELLSEYQDYTDKRLAIEKKFNDDLAALQSQRKQAESDGDTGRVEQINRAITQATKEKGKSLMGLDYDKLKESPEYVRAFENLKETSSETLNSLLTQLENAKQTAAEVLAPDELREYTTTIQDIMTELDERNPFQALADRKKELAEAEEELAEAKRNLDTVNSGGKVATGTTYNKETDKIEKTYLSSTEALEKYNKAKDKTVKADAKVHTAERKVNDVMGDLFDSIKNVGNAIGGEAGEIIGIIGDIGQFALMAMDGVETASKTASTAIQTVEKASVILAIISAAIQIATKIASLFNKTDYMAEFRKEMEELNYELELAKLNAEISTDKNSIFGDDLWSNAIKNVSLAETAFSKYNETLDNISNRRKSTSLKAIVAEMKGLKNTYDTLGESIANMEVQVRHKTWFRSAKHQSLKDAVPELFDEDGTVNQVALEKFIGSDTFKKLSGENQKYLKEMSDYWATYQDAVEKVNDYLTDIFGDLGNTMSNALVDAFKKGTDAAKSFTDSVSDMLETLANQMIYSVTLGPLIEEAQKKMLDVTKDSSLTDEQKFNNYASILEELTNGALGQQDAYNALLEKYKKMAEDKGFETFAPDTDEQGVTGKLEASLTEGTGNELVGLWNMTAMDIRALLNLSSQHYLECKDVWNRIYSIWDETQKIASNTERTANNTDGLIEKLEDGLKSVKEELSEIKKNTKNSNSSRG